MHTGNAFQVSEGQSYQGVGQQIRRLLLRKLWLPRIVYEALPYLYIALGVVALTSALFSPDWTWVLPYVVLLGLICLHAGLAIAALRYRFRRRPRLDS